MTTTHIVVDILVHSGPPVTVQDELSRRLMVPMADVIMKALEEWNTTWDIRDGSLFHSEYDGKDDRPR